MIPFFRHWGGASIYVSCEGEPVAKAVFKKVGRSTLTVKDAVELCIAGRKQGMKGPIVERIGEVPSSNNSERDFHRLARRAFDVPYELYYATTHVKDPVNVTKSVQVPMLMPHGIAH